MGATKQRNDPANVEAKVGLAIFMDFYNCKETRFNPYNLDKIGSEEHYNSNVLYKGIAYDSFKALAGHLAINARAVLRKPLQVAQVKPTKPVGDVSQLYCNTKTKTSAIGTSQIQLNQSQPVSTTPLKTRDASKPTMEKNTDIEAPLVCEYPNKNILVVFDFDGEVGNPEFNKIFFSDCGMRLYHFSKRPKMADEDGTLLSLPNTVKERTVDVDQQLLRRAIDEMREDVKYKKVYDKDGYELRSEVHLPYACKKQYHNNNGTLLNTYMVITARDNYTYALCWLVPEEKKEDHEDNNSL